MKIIQFLPILITAVFGIKTLHAQETTDTFNLRRFLWKK